MSHEVFLSSAIVGGAIIPLLQGVIADHLGIHHAFFLPVICYLYIVYYALARFEADGGGLEERNGAAFNL